MGLFSYVIRVNKISKNPTATVNFTAAEIVSAIVNLSDAKKVLSEKDFFYVNVIFEIFRQMKTKLLLDQKGFLGVSNEIIAHFDLVAPYHKFCGNQLYMVTAEIMDDYKQNYRMEAKKLLVENKLLRPEWTRLHKNFLDKFYSIG